MKYATAAVLLLLAGCDQAPKYQIIHGHEHSVWVLNGATGELFGCSVGPENAKGLFCLPARYIPRLPGHGTPTPATAEK